MGLVLRIKTLGYKWQKTQPEQNFQTKRFCWLTILQRIQVQTLGLTPLGHLLWIDDYRKIYHYCVFLHFSTLLSSVSVLFSSQPVYSWGTWKVMEGCYFREREIKNVSRKRGVKSAMRMPREGLLGRGKDKG